MRKSGAQARLVPQGRRVVGPPGFAARSRPWQVIGHGTASPGPVAGTEVHTKSAMANRTELATAQRRRRLRRAHRLPALLLVLAVAAPVAAQTAGDTVPRKPKIGAQFVIPAASIVAPGLGQYLHGAYWPGMGYTGTAVGGAAVAAWADDGTGWSGFPRHGRDQLEYEATHVVQSAGFLSAWDAFRRAVPSLQRQGKYEFLTTHETLGDLLTAPFDPEFLRRPTTWAHLAYTGLVAAMVVSTRQSGVAYEPFRAQDAAFATSLSYNAGVSEEALFRGWLFPVLYQNMGQRFWLSNAAQAGIFGALHLEQAGAFAAAITAWALYEGWLTRRNDWSIRESIFHHFWYDVAAVVVQMLVEERGRGVGVTVPVVRF